MRLSTDSVRMPKLLYNYYERRLVKEIDLGNVPAHIGVMVDGNRRWARLFNAPSSQGHQAGADKIIEFLGWCQELGIKVVTLYMLSTDNMSRSAEELDELMGIIANTFDVLDAAAVRIPHVAKRLQRVLFLRSVVAGVQEDRLPACPARLRRAKPPLRRLGPLAKCIAITALK